MPGSSYSVKKWSSFNLYGGNARDKAITTKSNIQLSTRRPSGIHAVRAKMVTFFINIFQRDRMLIKILGKFSASFVNPVQSTLTKNISISWILFKFEPA